VINDRGQMVGFSIDAPFNMRALVWLDGWEFVFTAHAAIQPASFIKVHAFFDFLWILYGPLRTS